ncbi:MAG: Smr/MutS family protein [Gammaproteobacteria bacterium]
MKDKKKQRKPSRLSQEDQALWKEATDGVEPLRQKEGSGKVAPGVKEKPATYKLAKSVTPPPEHPRAPAPKSVAKMDPRLVKKLGQGQADIDSRIDMHGLTQQQAQNKLLAHLMEAQAEGDRIVLAITGKGTHSALTHQSSGKEGGVIRSTLPKWLNSSEFRYLVSEYAPAHRKHGGSGAYYVRVRRK